MAEIWKPIKDYEGLYEISNLGRVKSLPRNGTIKTLKALVADVPYSNKKLASMDMEERYRLIISTILNAIGLKVEVEHMLATGRIDLIAQTSRYIYVIELKLKNNGGKKAAIQQILDNKYLEPFMADKRKVIGLGIELDEEGKGLLDWGITDF